MMISAVWPILYLTKTAAETTRKYLKKSYSKKISTFCLFYRVNLMVAGKCKTQPKTGKRKKEKNNTLTKT